MQTRNVIWAAGLLCLAILVMTTVGSSGEAPQAKDDPPKHADPVSRQGNSTIDDLLGWRKADWSDAGLEYTVQARAGRQLKLNGSLPFIQLECQDVKKSWIRLSADDAARFADFCEKPVGGVPEEGLKGDLAIKVRTFHVTDCLDPRQTMWIDYMVETSKFENNRVGTATFFFNPKAYAEAIRAALKDLEGLKKFPINS